MVKTLNRKTFLTEEDIEVPTVRAEEMSDVDRLAVEEVGLGLLQMMENAGRNLARLLIRMLGSKNAAVTVVAGGGGNGGGGLCAARHLANHGWSVKIILDREPEKLEGAAARQLNILLGDGFEVDNWKEREEIIQGSDLVIDALIGYGLKGAPEGKTRELISLCEENSGETLSLDVSSGLNATDGNAPGPRIHPDTTLTLALPKTGLLEAEGEIFLGDIGIPASVFRRLGVPYDKPFRENFVVRLEERSGDFEDGTKG